MEFTSHYCMNGFIISYNFTAFQGNFNPENYKIHKDPDKSLRKMVKLFAKSEHTTDLFGCYGADNGGIFVVAT